MLLAEHLEIVGGMGADLAVGGLGFLGKSGGGSVDQLGDGGRLCAHSVLEDEEAREVERIVARFHYGAVGRAGDRVFVGLALDLAVLGDGTADAHEEEGFEPGDVGDAADFLMQRVGETPVRSLAGLGMDAEVVLEVDPGGESGVELFEGLEAGALGFALEVVFDGLVDRFDLAFAVGLVGLVVKLGRFELAEDPGELLGDVNRTVIQIDLERNAPAKDQAFEGVLHAGELFVEVVPARENLAGIVVDPDEKVGLPLAVLCVQPDAVAGVALNKIQRACGLEAVVGHASVFAQQRISCLL